LTVLSLDPAHAATDEEKFRKLLNQTTIPIGSTPSLSDIVQRAKVACVCMAEGTNPLAGVLVRRVFGDDQVSFLASCFVPSFDPAGSASVFFECLDWELLAKGQ
jgi:hypothetical protein